jgi:hypothetical protein
VVRPQAQQRAGSAKSGKALNNALSSVRTDAKAIPKFDIGVPVHHESWDPKETTPLVAFHHRQEIDDTELERVKAYDAQGNVHWLDAQEVPEQPVVVVGVNERTQVDGTPLPAYQEEPPTEKATTNDCLEPTPIRSPSLEQVSTNCTGGVGGGGGGSSDEPREYGNDEILEAVNIDAELDNWFHGDPEFVAIARPELDTGELDKTPRLFYDVVDEVKYDDEC